MASEEVIALENQLRDKQRVGDVLHSARACTEPRNKGRIPLLCTITMYVHTAACFRTERIVFITSHNLSKIARCASDCTIFAHCGQKTFM